MIYSKRVLLARRFVDAPSKLGASVFAFRPNYCIDYHACLLHGYHLDFVVVRFTLIALTQVGA